MIGTPLSTMRQAAGHDSLRELARRLGCSVQALSAFEQGRSEIGDELRRKYAKAIAIEEPVVRRLQLQSQVQFHRREAARAEAALKAAMPRPRGLAAAH